MSDENMLIYGGYGLVSGWSALASYEGSATLTCVMRLMASAVILIVLLAMLPGTTMQSLGQAGIFFAMFMAVPVLIGSYVLGLLRKMFGTAVYLVLLVVATASYVAAFTNYLKS